MGEAIESGRDIHSTQKIDWMDWKCAVFVGIVAASIKLLAFARPDWHLGGIDGLVAFLLTLGYIVARARRAPEKLDEWGITTRVTRPAIATGFVLLVLAALFNAVLGIALAGKLDFDPSYVPRMIDYIISAFPQQFFMCSVGLVTLAKLRPFRGLWRLPLAVGLVFSLAHFWTPARIPGTIVPLQMVITFPAGFAVSLYFLKFWTILPLTAIHAIVYVLLHNWVEVHL